MVINQYGAIGDILFLEPMFRHYWKTTGVKPIVPIHDHLMWLYDHIESAEFRAKSSFPMDYDSIRTDDPDYLPMRFANQIIRNLSKNDHHDFANMMGDKYILAGMEVDRWTQINLKFNFKKAYDLSKEICRGMGAREYIVINNHSQAGNTDIKVKTRLPIIEMRETPGFTLIDWYLVIFRSKEFHTVSTSTFYLLQAMKNKTPVMPEIYIYPRPNADGLQGISQLRPTFHFHRCQ